MPINGTKKNSEQRLKTEHKYVLAALGSLCAGIVSVASLGLWGLSQVDKVVQEKGTVVFLALLLVVSGLHRQPWRVLYIAGMV